MEKRLQRNVRLAYKRPRTVGNVVTCYRKPSFGLHEAMSRLCDRCALCGNHGSQNSMAPSMKHIRTPNGERRLTAKLNCKDYGIYATCRKNCDNYYVGHTMTSFSQSWTKHRSLWNESCYTQNNNNSAFLRHKDKRLEAIFTDKPDIAQCFLLSLL